MQKNLSFFDAPRGVDERLPDIFRFQIGIGVQYLLTRLAGRQ